MSIEERLAAVVGMGGSNAVTSGADAEDAFMLELHAAGLRDLRHDFAGWMWANDLTNETTTEDDLVAFGEYVKRAVLGKGEYGYLYQATVNAKPGSMRPKVTPDFIVYRPHGRHLVIEVKFQASCGSINEKARGLSYHHARNFPNFNLHVVYVGDARVFDTMIIGTMMDLEEDRAEFPGLRANFHGFQNFDTMMELIYVDEPTIEQQMAYFEQLKAEKIARGK